MSAALQPPDPACFGSDAFAAATGATAEMVGALEAYRDLLGSWNERMNLVGPSVMRAFWLRHALDSAQLLDHASGAKVWADLGAGSGFPGLVLAILLKDTPGAFIHLVESSAKRCFFLRAVSAELRLPVAVHHLRAEDTTIPGVEVVTARACAPLSRLLGFAWPLLGNKRADETIALFLKGKGVDRELTAARQAWEFQAERRISRSDASGRVLRIESLRRAR